MMKKDRKHLAAIALALALAVSGCGSGAGEESTGVSGPGGSGTESSTGSVLTPDKPQLAEGIVNLSEQVSRVDIPTTEMSLDHGTALSGSGIRMLDQLIKTTGDPKANYLISPTSLQMALGMTVTGADAGTATEKELMAVLMPGTDGRPDTLNEEMATFANRMLHSDGVSWNVANSIWVRNNINVALRDSYVSDVTNSYAAELFSAPFDQSTLDSINSWVNTNTKERIPKILDKLDQNAALVLINALAFDGEWEEPYETSDVQDGTFKNADGTSTDIKLLWSKEDAAILLDGGVGVIKPYKGGEYSFVAILPPAEMTATEYLAKLAGGSAGFSDAYLHMDTSKGVQAAIPEFSVEYGTKMDQTLKDLGVKEAYTDAAHFRAMLTEESAEVKIGTVIHKTMIKVDRKGTVAAASTTVEMRTKGAVMTEPPYQVILDRPFVYGIVDAATGVPVFLGVQNKMN